MTSDSYEAAALWWPVVREARWFQGKGRDGTLVGVHPLPWLVPPPAPVRVRPEIATVSYADGGAEAYQLLVAYRDLDAEPGEAEVGVLGEERVSDAPRDPEAIAAAVSALLTAYELDEGADSLGVEVAEPLPPGDLTPRWYAGQQSNTNVFLGHVALLKVFRKLEPGANLDIEVTDHLRRAGVTEVPRVYGWLMASVGGQRFDLASMTELLRHPEDGWELASAACAAGQDFTADAAALGRALADVHGGLADTTGIVRGDDVADTMAARLQQATLAAPVLAGHRDALVALFDRLRGREIGAQRGHGDFHLGQTLRTPDGWRIIDFEGEPLKSMAERRVIDSPVRDVAGMLRSLSYATSAADDPGSPAALAWMAEAREAFLGAYCDQRGGGLDEDVLAAYEADKAVYEVVYEVRNRPDWLPIPTRALEQLTRAASPAQAEG